jgi:hypothetical protein
MTKTEKRWKAMSWMTEYDRDNEEYDRRKIKNRENTCAQDRIVYLILTWRNETEPILTERERDTKKVKIINWESEVENWRLRAKMMKGSRIDSIQSETN